MPLRSHFKVNILSLGLLFHRGIFTFIWNLSILFRILQLVSFSFFFDFFWNLQQNINKKGDNATVFLKIMYCESNFPIACCLCWTDSRAMVKNSEKSKTKGILQLWLKTEITGRKGKMQERPFFCTSVKKKPPCTRQRFRGKKLRNLCRHSRKLILSAWMILHQHVREEGSPRMYSPSRRRQRGYGKDEDVEKTADRILRKA